MHIIDIERIHELLDGMVEANGKKERQVLAAAIKEQLRMGQVSVGGDDLSGEETREVLQPYRAG
jgi:ribosomal silencing factor RsfS